MAKIFNDSDLKELRKPEDGFGKVTIIGGSSLFHGAPILSLKVASRVNSMVFFASPEKSVGYVAEQIKSKLMSFIWIPWEEVGEYIKKSDAVLIGPGFMRYKSEKLEASPSQRLSRAGGKSQKGLDEEGKRTREITQKLLKEFPDKKWVIDAGSLQVMDTDWIPKSSILTPNRNELEMLFKAKIQNSKTKITNQNLKLIKEKAERHKCIIVVKGLESFVCDSKECFKIPGGNAGLNKGGTGDVLAGLSVALLANNEPFLAACAASYISKRASDELYKKVGTNYNADDLADRISQVLKRVVF